MSDQLDLLAPERPRPGRVKVRALAETTLGFVRPGYGGAGKIPAKVLAAAEEAVEKLLVELDETVTRLEAK